MSDSRSISGTVQVEQEGRHAVAFKLMELIGRAEYKSRNSEQASRDYWLQLYVECNSATRGGLPERLKNG